MADEIRLPLPLQGAGKRPPATRRHPLKVLAISGLSGLAFLVPLLLVIYLLDKAVAFTGRLAVPISRLFPERIVGIGGQTLVGLALLIILSLAAGMLTRTSWGKSLFDTLAGTIVGGLPQFVAARAVSRILAPEDGQIAVVLVPVGARWAIGFTFGALDRAWISVYLPNAPRCTSGSVTLVRPSDIHPLDIDVVAAVRLIRRLGDGAERVLPDLTLPPAAQPQA